MDAEDICIISTPQPRGFRQSNSVASATAYQQSGKKRRAPCRRQRSKEDEKQSAQNDDGGEMPAAKRFKRSAPELPAFSTIYDQQHSTATAYRHETAIEETSRTPALITTPRQKGRISTVTEKHEMGLDRSRAQTPENSPKMICSHFESPHQIKNYDDDNEFSSPARFVTPPTYRSGLIKTPLTALGFNTNNCLSNKSPTRKSSPLPGHYTSELSPRRSLSPVSPDPYKTPRRASHRSKHSISNELQNATPERTKTPNCSSRPLINRQSPATPRAPLRARRDNRQSLIHAILSGNKREVEAALIAGEDPNEEIPIPVEEDDETTRTSPTRRRKMLPILAAAKLNNPACVIEKLIVHGAVPNSVNSLGQTALHIICQQKFSKQQKSWSQVAQETPSSCRSSPSTPTRPIPQSWLKLQEFFETLSPELSHNSSMNLTGETLSKKMLKSIEVNGDDKKSDENLGTPKLLTRRSQHDREQLKFQFTNIEESELALTVKVLLKHGTDRTRKDSHGKTAAEYAKVNGLWTLYEILSSKQSCHKNCNEEGNGRNQQQKPNKSQTQSPVTYSHREKSLLEDSKKSPALLKSVYPESPLRPATRQTSMLSFFPFSSSHQLSYSNSKPCLYSDGTHASSHYHGGAADELRSISRKEVEPPDRREKKPPPLLLLSSLSTQSKRSHHEETSGQKSRCDSSVKSSVSATSTTRNSTLNKRSLRSRQS